MERPVRAAWLTPVRLGALLIVGLFVLCVVRAARQSISHDEALTWLWYLSQPFPTFLQSYQANNHVLHTGLAWLAVHAFGNSVLAIRLAALLGGAIALVAMRRLSRRIFGDGWMHLLALILLAANPLVLDFFVAARGYGMALGLLLWAAIVLLGQIDAAAAGQPARPATTLGASLLLGACVTASLAFLPAAAALAAVAWLCGTRRIATGALLLLPGAALALALLVPPMQGITRATFIAGVDSLAVTGDTLVQHSLAHHAARWLPVPAGVVVQKWLIPAGRSAAVLLIVLLLGRAVRRLLRPAAADADDRALSLLGNTLLLTLLLLFLLHVVGGLLYPSDRTALFLLPLTELPALLLVQHGLLGRWRPLASGFLALLVAAAALHLAELQVSQFTIWPLDSGVRRLFGVIEQRQARHPEKGVQIRVADKQFAPPFQFYRDTLAPRWIAPVPQDWDRSDMAFNYLVIPFGPWGTVLAGDLAKYDVLCEAGGLYLVAPKTRKWP